MPKTPHRIRKQRWQIRCASKTTAFHLRQRFHDDWQDFFLPAFERAFDQEFGGEEVTHLGTINLRLSFASEETMFESLPESLHRQLARQVRDMLFQRPNLLGKPAVCRRSSPQQDRLETLLRYLRTGNVPWEATGNRARSLAEELRETCREQWSRVQALLEMEPASAEFYFRLLQLIAPADADLAIGALLENIPPPLKPPLLEVLHLLREPARYLTRHGQLQLSALLLSEVISRRGSWVASDFLQLAQRYSLESAGLNNFLSTLPAASAALFRNINRDNKKTGGIWMAKPSFGSVNPTVSPKQNAADFIWGLPGPAPSQSENAKNVSVTSSPAVQAWPRRPLERLGTSIARDSMSSGSPADQTSLSKKAKLLPEGSDKENSFVNQPLAAADFPLRVTHAGLVLLHPFLSRLFASIETKAETKAELSSYVLPRASALLHFLATGHDAIYEYDTAFIKVLLGVDPGTSLCVSDGLLASNDKLEAEALLRAAITHWSALKATSIEGFRASFLQRLALLRDEDGSWRLQIEREPFDMLLEHLPWSIGVVKLPWMARPLYTEW